MDPLVRQSFQALEQRIDGARSVANAAQRRIDSLGRRLAPPERNPAGRTIIRSAVCMALAAIENTSPEIIAERLFPRNERIGEFLSSPGTFLSKAATGPAMISDPAWAGHLSGDFTISAVASIAAMSTYSQLARRALVVNFPQGIGAVRLPSRAALGDLAGGFHGEGQPIPVRKGTLAATTIAPYLLGVISTYTAEIARYSTPQFEGLLADMMASDTAMAIDTALLDDEAGTAVRPPGLLNGLTPIPPTAGGGQAALVGDIGAISEAIPRAVGLVYLMTEAMKSRALLLSPGAAALDIITAPLLPEKTMLAIDASDLAISEGAPDFSITQQAAVVSQNSEPMPDWADGATESLFHQNLWGIRLLQDVSWGMRRPGRVAAIEAVTW